MKHSIIKRISAFILIAALTALSYPITASAAASVTNFKTRRYYNDRFSDVSSSSWYYESVKAAYQYGLIDGESETAFNPDGKLTYAEAIKLAACFHEIYTTGYVSLAVNASDAHWYDSYVNYAEKNGLIDFKITDYEAPADRGYIVMIFYEAMKDGALTTINDISDGDIPDVSETGDIWGEAVYALYRAGVLRGNDAVGTFEAATKISRCEISAIIYRMSQSDQRTEITLSSVITYDFYRLALTSGKLLEKVTTTFKYSDRYFTNPSDELNPSLAKVGVALSAASYSSESVSAALKLAGYDILEQNYESEEELVDTAAYTIAHKTADVAGETKNIYTIVIRGTATQSSEWQSNCNIGETEGADHLGFTNCADSLVTTLESLITTPAASNVIFFTGHSRGAAVSAIAAGRLSDSRKLAAEDSIYAYVFACPSYTVNPKGRTNIFYYNDPGDVLIGSPFTAWGYVPDGVKVTLSASGEVMSTMNSNYYALTGSNYSGLTDISEYNALFAEWCPTKADYYDSSKGMSPYETLVMLVSLDLSADSAITVVKMMLTYRFSQADIKIIMKMSTDLVSIYRAHAPETYISWVNALYAE